MKHHTCEKKNSVGQRALRVAKRWAYGRFLGASRRPILGVRSVIKKDQHIHFRFKKVIVLRSDYLQVSTTHLAIFRAVVGRIHIYL